MTGFFIAFSLPDYDDPLAGPPSSPSSGKEDPEWKESATEGETTAGSSDTPLSVIRKNPSQVPKKKKKKLKKKRKKLSSGGGRQKTAAADNDDEIQTLCQTCDIVLDQYTCVDDESR